MFKVQCNACDTHAVFDKRNSMQLWIGNHVLENHRYLRQAVGGVTVTITKKDA